MLAVQVTPEAATSAALGDDIAVSIGVNVAPNNTDTQAQADAKASVKGSREFLNQVARSGGGTLTFDQYFTFSDSRTGTASTVIPNSGFTHLLEVPYPGDLPVGGGGYTRAAMNVTKKPGAVTIGAETVTAGKAAGGADAVVTFNVTAPQ